MYILVLWQKAKSPRNAFWRSTTLQQQEEHSKTSWERTARERDRTLHKTPHKTSQLFHGWEAFSRLGSLFAGWKLVHGLKAIVPMVAQEYI